MNIEEMKKKYGDAYIGNVIRITDNRTLIVNVGKKDLQVGDIIQVYEPGDPLKDLDGNILCNFDYVKDELEVIQTNHSYSVCQKKETVTKQLTFALSPLLEQTEYVPLNIDENDIQSLQPRNPLIKIGDPIKLA